MNKKLAIEASLKFIEVSNILKHNKFFSSGELIELINSIYNTLEKLDENTNNKKENEKNLDLINNNIIKREK